MKQRLKRKALVAGIDKDQEVWEMLFRRQTELAKGKASKAFIEGLKLIGFDEKAIPSFDAINDSLKGLTGWQIVPVGGLIEVKEFFKLISKKRFPMTTWIRPMEKLDYIQEPDLFHDIFGHAPMLTNKPFCDFMEAVGKLAVRHEHSQSIRDMLDRLWWFTVEFGLVKENEEVKIFGGGILSSKSEVAHSLSDKPKRKGFAPKDIMGTPFRIDRLQEVFFVVNSFEDLFNSIKTIEVVEEQVK